MAEWLHVRVSSLLDFSRGFYTCLRILCWAGCPIAERGYLLLRILDVGFDGQERGRRDMRVDLRGLIVGERVGCGDWKEERSENC